MKLPLSSRVPVSNMSSRVSHKYINFNMTKIRPFIFYPSVCVERNLVNRLPFTQLLSPETWGSSRFFPFPCHLFCSQSFSNLSIFLHLHCHFCSWSSLTTLPAFLILHPFQSFLYITVRVILNSKSDHVTLLLKSFSGFPLVLELNPKFYKTWIIFRLSLVSFNVLHTVLQSSFNSLSTCFLFHLLLMFFPQFP